MVAIALSNNVLMRLDLTNPSEIDSKCQLTEEMYLFKFRLIYHKVICTFTFHWLSRWQKMRIKLVICFFSVSLTESKLHGLELTFCKFCFFMSNSVLVLQQWTFCTCLVVHGCALWWKKADCSFELWDSYFW